VRSRLIGPLVLLAAAGVVALPAEAQLTPVSQARSADFSWSTDEGTYFCLPPPDGCSPIDVTHTEDQGDDQAPDFATWSASLGGIVSIDSSALGPTGFTASASHAGSGAASFMSTGEPFEAYALSTFMDSHASVSYAFSVAEPTPYRLSGTIGTGGAGQIGLMLARIRMTGPEGELWLVELAGDPQCFEPTCLYPDPESLDVTGVLAPGAYTVEADLDGEGHPLISISTGVAAANDYQGSFQLTLTTAVPVPGVVGVGTFLLVAALAGSGCRLSAGRQSA
jgi:hypothetical protein